MVIVMLSCARDLDAMSVDDAVAPPTRRLLHTIGITHYPRQKRPPSFSQPDNPFQTDLPLTYRKHSPAPAPARQSFLASAVLPMHPGTSHLQHFGISAGRLLGGWGLVMRPGGAFGGEGLRGLDVGVDIFGEQEALRDEGFGGCAYFCHVVLFSRVMLGD